MTRARVIEAVAGGAVRLAWADPGELAAVRSAAFGDLSPAERARVEAEADRGADEFLLGRYLLRRLVREADPRGGDVVVVTAQCARCGGPHGRPVVQGRPVLASIAHAGGLVVAAVAPAGRSRGLGVDVEALPQGENRHDDDVRAWVRYEAVMKADGGGVAGNRGEVGRHVLEELVGQLPVRYDVVDVEIEGFAVAVAAAVG